MDSKLIELAVNAANKPDRWQTVLTHIMGATGAPAAMITLRDTRTCYIVNDDALEQEYHSPLIAGFRQKAISTYLNELRTIDPWAKAQRKCYPHTPVLMSKVCPLKNVANTQFFSWLDSLGIHETVAVELDRHPDHWTALNVFAHEAGSKPAYDTLNYVKIHLSILRQTWKMSQRLVQEQSIGNAVLDHLSNLGIPVCVLNSNGAVLEHNLAFEELAKAGSVRVLGAKKRLSIAEAVEATLSINEHRLQLSRFEGSSVPLHVKVSPFNSNPLYASKLADRWLLSFTPSSRSSNMSSLPIDLTVLTEVERQLFDKVRERPRIDAAGRELGMSRSSTFNMWGLIKSKLGVSSVHQIR